MLYVRLFVCGSLAKRWQDQLCVFSWCGVVGDREVCSGGTHPRSSSPSWISTQLSHSSHASHNPSGSPATRHPCCPAALPPSSVMTIAWPHSHLLHLFHSLRTWGTEIRQCTAHATAAACVADPPCGRYPRPPLGSPQRDSRPQCPVSLGLELVLLLWSMLLWSMLLVPVFSW